MSAASRHDPLAQKRIDACLRRDVPTVSQHETVAAAAELLAGSTNEVLPVLDDKGAVIGCFSEVDLVEALFPPYLQDLHNTHFLRGTHLVGSAQKVMNDEVGDHLADEFHVVEYPASEFQLAEHFMHRAGSIVVVDKDDHLVGVIGRAEFCRVIFGEAMDQAEAEHEVDEGTPRSAADSDPHGGEVTQRSRDDR